MHKNKNAKLIFGLIFSVYLSLFFIYSGTQISNAATFSSSSVSLSDSRPSTSSVSYTVTLSNVTTSTIKCIKTVFATTATGSTVPTGMTTTSAAFSGSSNIVPTPAGWTVDASSNGTVKLTNASGETPASASSRTLILTGITNGSTAGTSYFAQVSTYNNTDCSSSAVDSGTMAFIFTTGQTVSLTVDPSLSFSVAAVTSGGTVNSSTTNISTTTSTIPFGTVTSSTNAIAAHDLSVTTNAGNGYTVYVRYTAAPTNGSHSITDHSGSNASPSTFSSAGTESFGYTTEDTSLGTGTAGRFASNKWAAFTTSNAEVVYSSAAVSAQTTRVGYQVGISGTTPAGSYTSSVILTATPTY